MKRIVLLALAAVLSVSLAVSPVFMADGSCVVEAAYAAEDDGASSDASDNAIGQIEGKTLEELKSSDKYSMVLEDPEFYRYFEVNDNGNIVRKQVSTSEIDEFIARMDANAEGIDDDELVEMNDDMTCVGCGVSSVGSAKQPNKYKDLKRYNCIDISWWQGKVTAENWKKIKNAGITHVILRCGYSTMADGEHNSDSTFAYNITRAYNAGLKIGTYYYSTATTASEAKSEAKYVKELIANYRSKLSLPVVFDYETGGRLTSSVMKNNGTASCKAFCNYMRDWGYTPMVYANYTTLKSYIDYKALQDNYKIWLAHYTTDGKATDYPGKFQMWQYSSSGKVNGLSGNIDINYIYDNGWLATAGAANREAVITCDMNYRTGPGLDCKKVGRYKSGKELHIIRCSGDWAKMRNGYYINRSHLKHTARTTCNLIYRDGPGTEYKKLGVFKKGTLINVVSVKDGWVRTKKGYYLSWKYLTIK